MTPFFRCEKVLLKIDLHVHSTYSYDSVITPRDLVVYAKKRGLDGVAIADHDNFDGALKMAKESDFFIVPGVEITSSEGHIIGLNVQGPVPKRLSADETVDRIHDAGGIAVACHPVTFYKGSLGKHVTSKFDAVEVINASAFPFNYSVTQGHLLASRLGIPAVAGSDAHSRLEIGYAYTVIDAEMEVDKVIKAITRGSCRPFGRAIPVFTRLKRGVLVFKKRS